MNAVLHSPLQRALFTDFAAGYLWKPTHSGVRSGMELLWLLGFGMFLGAAWNVWSTKSIQIDRKGMRIFHRFLIWSGSRLIAIDRNDPGFYSVEIVYRSGSIIVPADDETGERWLISEINSFLKNMQPGRIAKE